MRRSLPTITYRDAINLIRPQHLYTQTQNWQTKKELLVKRTHYIYILFAFMILNTFDLPKISFYVFFTTQFGKTRNLSQKARSSPYKSN
jgi:hypothetical protein